MSNTLLPGGLSNWDDTNLWKQLKQKVSSGHPEAIPVSTTLSQCMPDIQRVLAQAGTSPADFTLHDASHSFRVAQRMVQVIPVDVLPELSSYELAFLLLSAYLHDIGMTPERRKVSLHFQYLLTGDRQDLSHIETEEFQEWLDDHGGGIVPPLTKGQPYTVETLKLANELITYYCRYRHNDWSEDFIRKNLSTYKMGAYINWTDDLVRLCQSHQQGYHELIKESFNPKPVGSPSSIVHLRYLASVLRIADILEFDPERTPEVILRHREISQGSLIYWWKDHYISLAQEENRLVLVARPSSAVIHRAIDITIDQIDEELRLCRTLADETHFEACPGLIKKLPHRWNLVSSVHRDIAAKEDTYEYINGAFRPDTQKLLTLLSGVELYGSPLVAIRELLQNAFDAVREQIAWERFSQPNPSDPILIETLGKLHHVRLRLETSTEGTWLICTDTGVGMTKAIIRDYLLVSGAAVRHDILALERRCRAKGFQLGRTGQFGIGVLSYFMLANRVIIKTRRSQEPGDTEQTGWQFETEGIGSFGELRKNTSVQRGTEVRLLLRPEIFGGDVEGWFSNIKAYIKRVLIHVPCQFQLTSMFPACKVLSLPPGWVRTTDDFSSDLLEKLDKKRTEDISAELLSTARRQERQAEYKYWEEVRAEVKKSLRWKIQEGELPDNIGRYRIHFPYFDLPGGVSLGFLRIVAEKNNGSELGKLGMGYSFVPSQAYHEAWKGMNISRMRDHFFTFDLSDLESFHMVKRRTLTYRFRDFRSKFPIILEVDWYSPDAGNIAVNRSHLKHSEAADRILDWLKQEISEIYRIYLSENASSRYTSLNCRILGTEAPTKATINWLSVKENGANWRSIQFPATNSLIFTYSQSYPTDLFWKDKHVSIISCLRQINDDDHYDGVAWNSNTLPPDRVMLYRDSYYRAGIAPFWIKAPKYRAPSHIAGLTSKFPPKWKHLCGVQFDHYSEKNERRIIWNANHPLVRAIDSIGWNWFMELFKDSFDPISSKGDLLISKGRAAAWVLNCLKEKQRELWEGLVDRDSLFLHDLWRVLGLGVNSRRSNAVPICMWIEDPTDKRLRVLTPGGWTVITNWKETEVYLPDPGPEWSLISTKGERLGSLLKTANKNSKKKI